VADARTVGCSSRLSSAMAVATDSSAFELMHGSMRLLKGSVGDAERAHCRTARARRRTLLPRCAYRTLLPLSQSPAARRGV
jgi:hypothetical protein